MAGSQSSWLDRLLFGGIGLSLLVHALVLFGGNTTAPAAIPASGADELQHGRSLKQLDLGAGGLTGTLGDLNVVSGSCNCMEPCLAGGSEPGLWGGGTHRFAWYASVVGCPLWPHLHTPDPW